MLPRGQYIIGIGFHTLLSQVLLNVKLWKLEGKLPSQSSLVFTAFLSLVALWITVKFRENVRGMVGSGGWLGFLLLFLIKDPFSDAV